MASCRSRRIDRDNPAQSTWASPSSHRANLWPVQHEELLGAAIKGKREGLVIATKFGFKFDGNQIVCVDGSPANPARRAKARSSGLASTRSTCFISTASILDPHRRGRRRHDGLVNEGKVRHIALSEAVPETIRRAAKAGAYHRTVRANIDLGRDIEDGSSASAAKTASASSPIRRRPRLPRGRGPQPHELPETTGAATTRAIRKRISPPTSRSSTRSARSPTSMAYRSADRARVLLAQATTSCPSRAPSAASRW